MTMVPAGGAKRGRTGSGASISRTTSRCTSPWRAPGVAVAVLGWRGIEFVRAIGRWLRRGGHSGFRHVIRDAAERLDDRELLHFEGRLLAIRPRPDRLGQRAEDLDALDRIDPRSASRSRSMLSASFG